MSLVTQRNHFRRINLMPILMSIPTQLKLFRRINRRAYARSFSSSFSVNMLRVTRHHPSTWPRELDTNFCAAGESMPTEYTLPSQDGGDDEDGTEGKATYHDANA